MIIKKNKQNLNNKLMHQEEIVGEINDVTVNETILQEDATQHEDTKQNESDNENINLFDIENIDFVQRQERRRGSRRRGYRRIDDRNLVSRAKEEAENIKKYAFEEGYREGIEKSNSDIQIFRTEIAKFMNSPKDVFEYIAPDILEISVDIAKKIIKKELETEPQVLINTIVDVLKTVSKNEPKVTIRVKPQAIQFIKDAIPNISYQFGIEAKINIVADPSIEEGGCIFQTNNGIVDASIDTQLEIIKKSLEGN